MKKVKVVKTKQTKETNYVDIFNLENLSDCPSTVIKNSGVHSSRFSGDSIKLYSLFSLKKELTTTELVIGLYRKYKLKRTRDWVYKRIITLKRTNKIKVVKEKGKEYRYVKI